MSLNPTPTPIIDVHAHLIPPRLVQILQKSGQKYGVHVGGSEAAPTVRLEGSSWTKPIPLPLTRIDERIQSMDASGVDMQVLSSWIDFSGYTMPLQDGIALSELQNETIAEVAASNPGRYLPAGTVPLQDGEVAARMLEHLVKDYGMKAVQVATYFGGERFLDHDSLDPFYATAQDLGVLVLFHPYEENHPPGLEDYFLHNCIGYPLASAIALARMMFSGTFTRFPDLLCRFPHAGGYLPYQLSRIRRAHAVRPEAKGRGFEGDPVDVLKRLYFDTVTQNPATVKFLADIVGYDRLMMGSDYPFDMMEYDPVATVRQAVPAEYQERVLGGTVASMLCRTAGCGCNSPRLFPQTGSAAQVA